MKVGFVESRRSKFALDVVKNLESRGHSASFADAGSVGFDVLVRLNNSQGHFFEIQSFNGVYVLNNPFSIANSSLVAGMCDSMGIRHRNSFVVSSAGDAAKISPLLNFPVSVIQGNGDFFVVKSAGELRGAVESSLHDALSISEMIDYAESYRVFCFSSGRAVFVKHHPAKGYSDDFSLNRSMFSIERDSLRLLKSLDRDFAVFEWALDMDGIPFFAEMCDETEEIRRSIPPAKYSKIVEFFSEMVENVAVSGKKNKHIFHYT